ncbi:carbohydrate ABC transporter permease [Kribbella kalugense]|uniref:Carbohydrate ABC transporter membrane protein 2 (CUT1 family) n=1 Tax=Kribbella kalugense TaxID=2512221 RepID=A0A4R7ZF54_9ACTN|nr:carbohydrate ABC transporter permease [Kribbella kalugense]TDW15912.1 carbohydrate ABC transporter membrane protein 2 (CUT1 family) [Kribbella kalugense]
MTTLQHAPAARRRTRRWLTHLALIAGTLVMVYPLLWMVGGSFKDESDIFSQLNPFPSSLDPRNYIAGWTATDPTFTRFYVNSTLIAVLAVAGNVIACTLTAYAFARLEFRGKKVFFAIMLGSIMLPAHALLIPQYVLFFHLGWVNTYLPLVVPKFLATDAFFIFLMVQFIRTIPRTLDEAAMIDGCGKVRIFSRIILPLTGPVLITTAIFTFIWTYNDFFSQLIYLSYPSSETVPVALRRFVDATGDSSYGQLLAMSVLSLVPTFIVFLLAQRRIVEGIATTGLKG